MKQIISIQLTTSLEILVTGSYYPENSEVGKTSNFEIEKIRMSKGDILDLVSYFDTCTNNLVHIEEKCLEQIEK